MHLWGQGGLGKRAHTLPEAARLLIPDTTTEWRSGKAKF